MNIYLSIIKHDEHLDQWMDKSDILEANKFTSEKRQYIFLRGRASLRRLLFLQTGKNNWIIKKGNNGKPYVLNGPHISLSHSGAMIACALCMDAPIGIDIEQWKTRDFNAIASVCFTADHQQEIKQSGIEAFYKYWTIKEAIAKVDGLSIFSNTIQEDNILTCTQNIDNKYSLTIAAKTITAGTINPIQIHD